MRASLDPLFPLLAIPLAPEESEAQRSHLVPVGNYHAHVVSEASAKLLVVPPLPTVELPAELDLLVRDYERIARAGDADSFAALFTEDGLVSQLTGWARAREAIRSAAGNEPRRDLWVRATRG